MRIELPYVPQERQRLLHATEARQILYGGAAGGGKSYALRWDGYEFCMRNPGCKAFLVRQTLPQLETNHLIEVRHEIPEQLGRFNETKKRLDWKNGSVMFFRHCQYDRDLNDFQGAECHWLGIDEATLLQPSHLIYMKSRLRLGQWRPAEETARKRLPRLVFTGNPGGPSHHYLKGMFIDPAPPEQVFADAESGISTVFIPAFMSDNSYLDANYASQFSEMPEWQAQQLRDGDWSVVPGAFFDCWSSEMVIPPFQLPDYWPKYRSVDWGFATPFSIGEWTVSDGTAVLNKHGEEVTYPEGALIRIWEWYGSKKANEGLRRSPGDVASEVARLRGKALPGPGDPTMWRADMGPSPAEQMIVNGVKIFKGDNQRVAGWQEMYRRMKAGMLFVTEGCEAFIRTVPAMMADDIDPNDIHKGGEDHVADEARYMCMARAMKRTAPKKARPLLSPIRFSDLTEPTREEGHRWI